MSPRLTPLLALLISLGASTTAQAASSVTITPSVTSAEIGQTVDFTYAGTLETTDSSPTASVWGYIQRNGVSCPATTDQLTALVDVDSLHMFDVNSTGAFSFLGQTRFEYEDPGTYLLCAYLKDYSQDGNSEVAVGAGSLTLTEPQRPAVPQQTTPPTAKPKPKPKATPKPCKKGFKRVKGSCKRKG